MKTDMTKGNPMKIQFIITFPSRFTPAKNLLKKCVNKLFFKASFTHYIHIFSSIQVLFSKFITYFLTVRLFFLPHTIIHISLYQVVHDTPCRYSDEQPHYSK